MFSAFRIREMFLDFFAKKNHEIFPSAPMVMKDDPTLLFTNAGMNQFKDYFLGNKTPKHLRIADTQKCLRVSGKHNDLEEVGKDTYHHTMFEMLGNWSFGDYFKKEAIRWAWELLTEVYQLPKDRMYATVFEGNSSENIGPDEEATKYWQEFLPLEKIIFCGKKDNFWEMGEMGPCGPCSEIHIDLRSQEERNQTDALLLVNKDHPLVVEIWNLVFIQYNRKNNKELEKLPQSHVDTGMGLERLVMAVQGKSSNYDTDLFTPLISKVVELSNIEYGNDPQTDIAMRVIVDHIRAVSFAVADGLLPSNTKAGYVIRRILRRAVRYGATFLDLKKPFLSHILTVLVDMNREVFPELAKQQKFIATVLQEEENNFLHTLDRGLIILEKHLSQVSTENKKEISGAVAFELYDTYGFPFDLTELIAGERNFKVNKNDFDASLLLQKNRSKQAAKLNKTEWVELSSTKTTSFLGYDQLSASAHLTCYAKIVKEDGEEFFQLAFSQTPFYPQGGGQLGDRGTISNEKQVIEVWDTRKENELILHYTKELPQEMNSLFTLQVDKKIRKHRERNHSATHLLHAALREYLGNHVTQRGSLVSENILRFDFSHPKKLSQKDIEHIENRVNEKVREDIKREEKRKLLLSQAKAMGAMALFGEKYGNEVRVITFDKNFSVELCAGTHVDSSGEIVFFKILTETSVASGVRRIEAITGVKAEEYISSSLRELQEIKNLFVSSKGIKLNIESILKENQKLKKEIEKLRIKEKTKTIASLKEEVQQAKDFQYIFKELSINDVTLLRTLSFELKRYFDTLIIVFVTTIEKKSYISVYLSEDLIKRKNWDAREGVSQLAKEIEGKGGGQNFFATAGGGEIKKNHVVLKKAEDIFLKNNTL